jgi:hypothetical protein
MRTWRAALVTAQLFDNMENFILKLEKYLLGTH